MEELTGNIEKRYISQIKVNSNILKNVFNSIGKTNVSFNVMMRTTDHKILLLERTQSYHFPKVVRDLGKNKVDSKLLKSLFTSEVMKLLSKSKLSWRFQKELVARNEPKSIYIFPGGHANKNETVIWTLLRELREETSIKIKIQDLRFNQTTIFIVIIYDLLIKKHFINFVFPIKVDMSSKDVLNKFKETLHTRNPTFVDIGDCESLNAAFIRVQKVMLL